ncbi:MAG: hypothetical protein JSV62_06295 [Promethearchaeota archaeon]|nr:MAG: hypothetical protein JSV62_06295 [Candidatus Lokiarchaeota archaeon]
MVQQAEENLIIIDFVGEVQKNLNKRLEREKALVKMEEFLIKLNKEHKPVKIDLERILKKVELNVKYLESIVPVQEIKYQQVYRNYGIY